MGPTRQRMQRVYMWIMAGVFALGLYAMFSSRKPTPMEPQSVGQAARQAPGAQVQLKSDAVCASSREALDQITKWSARGQSEEFARAIIETNSTVVKAGGRVRILEPGVFATEVRAMDTGQKCWMSSDLVR